MNRNSQSHFAELPHENIQRSTFERPQNHKTTFNAGELIPFYIEQDVLPADTHKIKTTAIIRMSTPLHPTMDNAYIDIYYFFVPNRLLWEHWREFMGENRNGAWTQTTEYQVPQITFQDQTGFGTLYPVEKGDVAEKLGIPIGYNNYTNDGTISALPFRAYIQIWNRWFRDQNVTAPITEETGDGTHTISETSVYKKPQKVYKYHDYFTSALPAPQKGDAIQMPIGVAAPVNAPKAELINVQAQWYTQNGNQVGHLMSGVGSDKTVTTQNQTGYAQQLAMRPMGINGYDTWGGLYADLTQATAATVNALRLSVQIQRILEKDARGGTRYQEIIANHFKTTLPGEQWQPIYLGGRRIPINVTQILQTSETETTPLGETGAYSQTASEEHDFTKSFVEHGIILGLCCVRTNHTYQQGIGKEWFRKRKLNYYWPTLAHIGEQPIYTKEIYATGQAATDNKIFGYQEAWAEYRYKTNRTSGEFSSLYAQTLDSWHYGDIYTDAPVLSTEFLTETKENIDRTIEKQSAIVDQFIADFLIENTTTRAMPIYSVPGMLDHF